MNSIPVIVINPRYNKTCFKSEYSSEKIMHGRALSANSPVFKGINSGNINTKSAKTILRSALALLGIGSSAAVINTKTTADNLEDMYGEKIPDDLKARINKSKNENNKEFLEKIYSAKYKNKGTIQPAYSAYGLMKLSCYKLSGSDPEKLEGLSTALFGTNGLMDDDIDTIEKAYGKNKNTVLKYHEVFIESEGAKGYLNRVKAFLINSDMTERLSIISSHGALKYDGNSIYKLVKSASEQNLVNEVMALAENKNIDFGYDDIKKLAPVYNSVKGILDDYVNLYRNARAKSTNDNYTQLPKLDGKLVANTYKTFAKYPLGTQLVMEQLFPLIYMWDASQYINALAPLINDSNKEYLSLLDTRGVKPYDFNDIIKTTKVSIERDDLYSKIAQQLEGVKISKTDIIKVFSVYNTDKDTELIEKIAENNALQSLKNRNQLVPAVKKIMEMYNSQPNTTTKR